MTTSAMADSGWCARDLARFVDLLADAAMVTRESDGTILMVNDATQAMFGWPRADMIGRTTVALGILGSTADRERVLHQNLNGTKTERDIEKPFHHRDGSRRLARFSLRRLTVDGVTCLLTVAHDVTDQRAHEQQLVAAESRFRTLIDHMPSGVAVYTLAPDGQDFVFTDINKAVERTEAVRREDVVGRRLTEMFPGAIDLGLVELLHRVHDSGAAVVVPPRRYRDSRGASWRRNVVFRLPGGEVVAIYDDVTDIMATEDALRRSNEDLERFAYVVSHDLKEPVRMVLAFAALLEQQLGDGLDDRGREFLGFITSGTRRMHDMIDALLAYSRLGHQKSPPQPVALAQVIADARDNLRATIAETGAELEVPDDLPTIQGHGDQLLRLFQNLFANALKYRHPDRPPRIALNCGRAEGGWLLTVTDNGIGIAEGDRDRVFQLFNRAGASGERDGYGIGLAECQRIAHNHGGWIRVTAAPEPGSRFEIHLGDPVQNQ